MAKEQEENIEQLDETADNNEKAESKKKKQKPSKEKKEGEIPLVLMIGGALGGVIIIIVSVIIGTIVANKMFPPQIGPIAEGENTEKVAEEGEHKEKLPAFPTDEKYDDALSLLEEDDWLNFNSERIQTNVSGGGKICILNIAIYYKPFWVKTLTEKGFLRPESEGGHGAMIPGGADTTNALYVKLKQSVSSKLLEFIGSHSEIDLQSMQSEAKLAETLKEYLKPTFKDTGLLVGKVEVTYFMLARM
jgi:flagellar basal body-associated protein FliL